MSNTTEEIYRKRENKVVKHNDVVQRSKYKMSTVELKTVAFLVSLIKPGQKINDLHDLEYEFYLKDYCQICGIDYAKGDNYALIRETLHSLNKRSVKVTLEDGRDTSVSWINKYWSNKGTGKAKIRFDEDMIPYLFDLRENTTRYELLNILPMQSKYSIRLYELCRSWAGLKTKTYTLEQLREILMMDDGELKRYPDFRRKVIEKAQEEINKYTDLFMYWEPLTKGRKTVGIKFYIETKATGPRCVAYNTATEALDGE